MASRCSDWPGVSALGLSRPSSTICLIHV
jgi:hypothetical protein